MSLPPLPETTWVDVPHFTFTCEAMRAYGQQCAEQERKRCVDLCEGVRDAVDACADGVRRIAGMNTAASCAAAIRSAE